MVTVNRRVNIAADVPPDLQAADEALSAYGRWAADRDSRRTCGSAEGRYRAESWHAVEDRRTPRQIGLTLQDALVCQRALARVADCERVVLAVLYVPRRVPAEVQLRMLRIPPQISQQRHLLGLRMFANWRMVLTSCADAYNART
jgi:hypothetical protein